MKKITKVLTGAMGKEALKNYIDTVLLEQEPSANADDKNASGVQSR